MRLTRIHLELPLAAGARITLPQKPSRHLVRVLRLGIGDPLLLFNGDGRDFPARILIPAKDAVQVQVAPPTDPEPLPRLSIHLGVGVSKGERMDLVVQKAVELGVASISALLTNRSMVRLDAARLERRRQHWRGILVAACEQSGRRRLPELSVGVSLTRWLSQAHPYPLLLDPSGALPLPAISAPAEALTLLIGPEGGIAAEERVLAERAGFKAVRLGPRVLRTETAPVAALAAVQTLWGDFR